MSVPTTLDRLKPGECGSVTGVDGNDELSQRLSDMGFWPGTEVRVIRRAPLGDPVQYSLRGFELALRADEARRVQVHLNVGAQS